MRIKYQQKSKMPSDQVSALNPASTDRRGPCGLKTGCPVCPVQRVKAGQNVGIGTGPNKGKKLVNVSKSP